MKILLSKLGVIFSVLLVINLLEAFLIRTELTPIIQYCNSLKLNTYKYICQGQVFDITSDGFIYEDLQLRIHNTQHKNEDSIFECENNKKNTCYVSAYSLINLSNYFFENLLMKGTMPLNENQILINQNLSRKLKINIGNEVIIKSPSLFKKVQITGIVKNFYGIPEYKKDHKYYLIHIYNEKYVSLINGKNYIFTDNPTGAFLSYNVPSLLSKYHKNILSFSCFFLLVNFLISIIAYMIYMATLELKKYFQKLYTYGKNANYILVQKIKNISYFLLILILIIVISFVFSRSSLIIIIGFLNIFLLFPFCLLLHRR